MKICLLERVSSSVVHPHFTSVSNEGNSTEAIHVKGVTHILHSPERNFSVVVRAESLRVHHISSLAKSLVG